MGSLLINFQFSQNRSGLPIGDEGWGSPPVVHIDRHISVDASVGLIMTGEEKTDVCGSHLPAQWVSHGGGGVPGGLKLL